MTTPIKMDDLVQNCEMEIVEDCVPEIVNEVDVHESEVPVKVSFIVGVSFESFEELEKK